MDELIGIIKLFAGDFAPQGWLSCRGQLLSIRQYSALYSILGTSYGGDGVTNFALPNLQSRVPVGVGEGPGLSSYQLGQTSGTEKVTLLSSNMPPHAHTLGTAPAAVSLSIPTFDAIGGTLPESGPGDSGLASGPGAATIYTSTDSGKVGSLPPVTATISLPGTTSVEGQGRPISTMPPYLALNYIICVEGFFPSRP